MPTLWTHGTWGAPPRGDMPPVLRVQEVASALGCTARHVQHLIEDGSLTAFDISASRSLQPCWRIQDAELLRFKSRKTQKGVAR